jgi:hypothetical protein
MLLSSNLGSLAALVSAISHPRLSNYRTFFNATDDAQALGLYQWNEDTSSALFRVISLVEIVLRNQFHKVLSVHHGTVGSTASRDWYVDLALPQESKQKVKKILERKQHGTWVPRLPTPSADDVVSKLTFGFWPHLIDVNTTTAGAPVDWSILLPAILPGHRQKTATYWAKQASQDAFFARMDLVNELRNRIAHHEPVWKLGALMEESRPRLHYTPAVVAPAPSTSAESLTRLGLYYARLTELLAWLSPSLAKEFSGSEADTRCKMLLTERTLAHYRGRQQIGRVQIANFAGNRRLRKMLKYASRRRQPLAVLDGSRVVGHWTAPPT